MLLSLGIGAAALVALDFTTSRLKPQRPVNVLHFGAPLDPRTPIVLVFPGFSNPAKQLGQGVSLILGPTVTTLAVDYGTSMDDERIYEAVSTYLTSRFGRVFDLSIYGHSMGGQVGAMFRQRYVAEGSPVGPIRRFIMDCSPMLPSSLQTPPILPPRVLRPLMRALWPGVLMSGVIALGHVASRMLMHPRLDDSVNRKLYRNYANAMTLFSAKAWRAQMLYMLSFGARLEESYEPTHYIGSEQPELDPLVRQIAAIAQWREKFPNFTLVQIDVSHAWPMEQPLAYAEAFQAIWKA